MKRFLLVLAVGLLLSGNSRADNSKFLGTYSVIEHYSYGASCNEADKDGSFSLTFGNNIGLVSDGYVYISSTQTSSFYTEPSGDQVRVTTNGNSITVDYVVPANGETGQYIFVFSLDYNTFSMSAVENGSKSSSDCTITISGSGTRNLNSPAHPILNSPSNGSTDVSLTPTLITGAFSDPDAGDIHQQTDWQVSTLSDFSSSVLYESSTSNLTSLIIPASALQENTRYYWRVKFYDNRNTGSEWSTAFLFTTLQTFTDINENGIPDALENTTADLNADGTADIQQTDEIKTLNTVVGSGQMGVSIKEATTVTQTVEVNSIDPDDISKYVRPHTMPLGMMSFKLHVRNPGETAHVKVYFSEAAPANASWFVHDSINGWSDYSQYVTFSNDRKSASVQLKDGGYGDSDGVENGIIVDPCGFGIASWLKGKVTDSANSESLTKGTVNISDIGLTLNTLSDGTYLSMMLPGTYDIMVSSSGYQSESMVDIEIPEADIVTKDIQLSGRCKITGLEVAGTPSTITPVALKVNAQSGSDTINYRYSVHDGYGTAAYDGSHWQSMSSTEYQIENSCDYTFGSSEKFIVVTWATSSGTDSVDPTGIPIIGWSVDTSDSACKTNFTGVTITGEQKVNENITFAVSAENSCGKSKYYRFTMHPYYGTDGYDGSHWESMTSTEWISGNSVDYTFTEAGKYIVVVWVADETINVDSNGIPIIGWSVDIE